MSGIFGVFNRNGEPVSVEALQNMQGEIKKNVTGGSTFKVSASRQAF